MKTEHILLGAGVIGVAAYLIKTAEPKKVVLPNGDTPLSDSDIDKAQESVDKAKEQVEGAEKSENPPAVNGRCMGGVIQLRGGVSLQHINALIAVEEAAAAVLAAESAMRLSMINMLKSGRSLNAEISKPYRMSAENRYMSNFIHKFADFYVNRLVANDLFPKMQDIGFKPFYSVKDLFAALGYVPGEAEQIFDIQTNKSLLKITYDGVLYEYEKFKQKLEQMPEHEKSILYLYMALFDLQIKLDNVLFMGVAIEERMENPTPPDIKEIYDANQKLENAIRDRTESQRNVEQVVNSIQATPSCVSNVNNATKIANVVIAAQMARASL
ncbi:MAG: hypothetical protein LBH25_10200 [Fibromonadaceae bacterium]|nr:hypothetical protein [Fibromonadaceae bacterium]